MAPFVIMHTESTAYTDFKLSSDVIDPQSRLLSMCATFDPGTSVRLASSASSLSKGDYSQVLQSEEWKKCRWTTSQGYAAVSARDALQRDTLEVGIALLTAASSSGQRCDSIR